ncbi:MAG TPA: hypothetical protein VIU61_23980 [Kofleriaceae bacterium]
MSDRRFTVALALAGIMAASCVTPASEELGTTESEVQVAVAAGGVSAGDGWLNGPIPQLDFGVITASFLVNWRASYEQQQTVPIDAVFGLANGPADAFSDLGPIVRMNAQGFVDVRDGGVYRADTAYDYRNQMLQVEMRVDLSTRRYSVWVNGVAIATDYAFRTEQSMMSRVDTLARTVDSAQGWIHVTNVDVGPSNCAYAGQSWVTQSYPTQTGLFYTQVDARVSELTDAVVGLAAAQPLSFTHLATVVRFRPDGFFDARDGGGYRADMAIQYDPSSTYRLTMIVDVPAKRYSVYVGSPYDLGLGQPLATSYAFRSEQAGATSLARIGSFTDGPGYVHTCYLNVWNHW